MTIRSIWRKWVGGKNLSGTKIGSESWKNERQQKRTTRFEWKEKTSIRKGNKAVMMAMMVGEGEWGMAELGLWQAFWVSILSEKLSSKKNNNNTSALESGAADNCDNCLDGFVLYRCPPPPFPSLPFPALWTNAFLLLFWCKIKEELLTCLDLCS